MIMISSTVKTTLYTIVYCHLEVDACFRIQMWQQWFLAMSVLSFQHRESCVICALCCVRNVSCLCSTSLPCNSTSRRRKERGSPTRFVMASVPRFPCLLCSPSMGRSLHGHVLSLIGLLGSGREQYTSLHPPLPACQGPVFSYKLMWASGDWGMGKMLKARAAEQLVFPISSWSPPTATRIEQTLRAGRMARQLKDLVTLPEDSGLSPNAYISTLVPDSLSGLLRHCIHMAHIMHAGKHSDTWSKYF